MPHVIYSSLLSVIFSFASFAVFEESAFTPTVQSVPERPPHVPGEVLVTTPSTHLML